MCLRGDSCAPSSTTIDGRKVDTCGRDIFAGELVATWINLSSNGKTTIRRAVCMLCYRNATLDYYGPGLEPGRFVLGRLKNCLTCGYHPAVIKEWNPR